jgi:hypothetical protein
MYWWNFNLFVIYGMWWNLNPACNIYSVYIMLQFSNGKETRTNEPASPLFRRHLCYGQETRTNEPTSLLLLARRYAKS